MCFQFYPSKHIVCFCKTSCSSRKLTSRGFSIDTNILLNKTPRVLLQNNHLVFSIKQTCHVLLQNKYFVYF